MELKQIKDLMEGKLIVVTESGKQYSGFYSKEFKCVFFTIPQYEVIKGYIQ